MIWRLIILSVCVVVWATTLLTNTGVTDGKVLNYTNQDDMVCLAKNIYWEARNESTAGRIAVAWTVINRVNNERFPDSICGVVQQAIRYGNGFPKRNKCQFSWYCDGRADTVTNLHGWRDSYRLASYVSNGRDHLLDITDGSLWYHASYVQPKWAKHKKKTAQIDTHIFYR
jgi:spore germination cell wall hydrolase CwlJ-like protein